MDMQNRFSQDESLLIATRMESRAIALYEQASLVFALGELKPVLHELLEAEKEHLQIFNRLLKQENPVPPARLRALDEEAGASLFGEGLEGAVHEGAFDSAVSLLMYAADEEERSAGRYRAFAENAQGEARKAFLFIAHQEDAHLRRLQGEVKAHKSRLNG